MDEVSGSYVGTGNNPPKEEIKLIVSQKANHTSQGFLPFKAGKDLVPEMPIAGEG
ncbi:MAG: hypothetical protein KIIPBIDF_01072 [Candidatus Methanoperedenaceae archaeon GB50]|nr:MAG: hypothetical protein KIIPBIDF_01072 [Candidatus Methanoperedenaceae archaeon GB50]